MQSETGFPSSHQLKSFVTSKSRLKLVARAVLSADAGLLVITSVLQTFSIRYATISKIYLSYACHVSPSSPFWPYFLSLLILFIFKIDVFCADSHSVYLLYFSSYIIYIHLYFTLFLFSLRTFNCKILFSTESCSVYLESSFSRSFFHAMFYCYALCS